MAKNNTPAEKPDNQESGSQLATDAQLSGSVENPIPEVNPIPIEKTDASTEGNAPANDDQAEIAESETEAQAKQLMREHKVSAIWRSTDGNWFTQKSAARAHDPESQCFTLETTAQ